MSENEQQKGIRDFMRRLGRNPDDQQVKRIIAIRTKLLTCELTNAQQMSFRLMVQGWKETDSSDSVARDEALTQLAILVDDGELEVAGNEIVLTTTGQQWLQQQQEKGVGQAN